IREITAAVKIPVIVGGGISSVEDIETLIHAGAGKISIGTAAVENPELVKAAASAFGQTKVIVAVDCKRTKESAVDSRGTVWEVYTQGGRTATGINALDWIEQLHHLGAGEILLTSMDGDGTRDGYDNELYRTVTDKVPVSIIASGGAGRLEHFRDAFLVGQVNAVLAASVFHRRIYSVGEVKKYLKEQGIPVKP
ncbi:MAG: imidazole glycerol phosphate synthase subunit HisF, partial [Firmicutes bacterium]|nr:imidazole glycerol phosphate synthase subunit HisF [Bacillota bacterium]